MGFRKIGNRIKIRLMDAVRKREFLHEICRVIRGVNVYQNLKKTHGSVHFVVIRGASGDVYIQYGLLNAYLQEKNITRFAVIGDGVGIIPQGEMFHRSDVFYVPSRDLDHLEKAFRFLNGKQMDIIIPYQWSAAYFGTQCRVRLTKQLDLMDTYCFLGYQMDQRVLCEKPTFSKVTEHDRFNWQHEGIIKGRTVIIAPDAYSVTTLPIWFWNGIIQELQKLGYTVFMNCCYDTFFRAPNLFCPYPSLVPMLEYAGTVIAIRSGLCNVISSAKCKKVILYPAMQKTVNYDFHRSEMEFSGLSTIGLCEKEQITEISTPLLQNVTDYKAMFSGTESYISAMERLRWEIIRQFSKQ